MKLMEWLKSRCRKKRCEYSLHFSGREGNIVDMQPKTRKDNRRTEGAIAHHEYEEAGEENIMYSIQNPKSKPKKQKVRKSKLKKWTRRITVLIPSLSCPITNKPKDSMEPTPEARMPKSTAAIPANCRIEKSILPKVPKLKKDGNKLVENQNQEEAKIGWISKPLTVFVI